MKTLFLFFCGLARMKSPSVRAVRGGAWMKNCEHMFTGDSGALQNDGVCTPWPLVCK